MSVSHAVGDVYAVDPRLMDTPGALTLYVVDAPEPAIVDTGSANSPTHIYEALSELDMCDEDVRDGLAVDVQLRERLVDVGGGVRRARIDDGGLRRVDDVQRERAGRAHQPRVDGVHVADRVGDRHATR